MASISQIDPPPRRWVVPGLIPSGYVTLLTGPGGSGKSLLGLMLQASAAARVSFLGIPNNATKTVGFYGEEDENELARRMKDVHAGLGINAEDTGSAYVFPLHGQDTVLAVWSNGKMVTTDRYQEFETEIARLRPDCVILDNIARMFSGNENDRSQVTQFITMLERWAIEYSTAVVLLGHPSKGGHEFSGSTAWEAAVRSRIYFGRPDARSATSNWDMRIVKVGKANFGPTGDEIPLIWENGCFRRVGATETHDDHAQEVLLDCLDRLRDSGRSASASRQASNYASRIMADLAAAKDLTTDDLARAMEHLFDTTRIVANARIGTRPDRHALKGIARTEWLKAVL